MTDGASIIGQSLQIQVNNLIPSRLANDSHALKQEIITPYEPLAGCLHKAEVYGDSSKQGIEDQVRPGVKKRVREPTPPMSRERRFRREELREPRRVDERSFT
jgi:hypothetical protein